MKIIKEKKKDSGDDDVHGLRICFQKVILFVY